MLSTAAPWRQTPSPPPLDGVSFASSNGSSGKRVNADVFFKPAQRTPACLLVDSKNPAVPPPYPWAGASLPLAGEP